MYEGDVFVVEGPGGFRCIGAKLQYGPDVPDGPPIVCFADVAASRFRYLVPHAPPYYAGDVATWSTDDGEWRTRPLTNADQAWVLIPGLSFPDFNQFHAWCVDYAGLAPQQGDANVGADD